MLFYNEQCIPAYSNDAYKIYYVNLVRAVADCFITSNAYTGYSNDAYKICYANLVRAVARYKIRTRHSDLQASLHLRSDPYFASFE